MPGAETWPGGRIRRLHGWGWPRQVSIQAHARARTRQVPQACSSIGCTADCGRRASGSSACMHTHAWLEQPSNRGCTGEGCAPLLSAPTCHMALVGLNAGAGGSRGQRSLPGVQRQQKPMVHQRSLRAPMALRCRGSRSGGRREEGKGCQGLAGPGLFFNLSVSLAHRLAGLCGRALRLSHCRCQVLVRLEPVEEPSDLVCEVAVRVGP